MKKSRFTEAQIMGVLRQAEGGLPVSELCRGWKRSQSIRGIDCSEQRDQQRDVLQMAREVWRHGCIHDEPE